MMSLYETERYYDANPVCSEIKATVLACTPYKNGSWAAILDRTVFFPEGGGQSGDTGCIDAVSVIDTQEEHGQILHICTAPISVGSEVTAQIDWDKRYVRMQNHTAEHLACGILHRDYGFENVGFHLGDGFVTFDVDGVLEEAELELVLHKCNRAITERRPVTAEYPSQRALSTISYRSKLELTDQVRIVTIAGYDVCACCAPHVANTAEIGVIQFSDMIHYKGGMRITLLAGGWAQADYRNLSKQNRAISRLLSVTPTDTVQGVQRLMQERDALRMENGSLKRQLATTLAATVPADAQNPVIFENRLDGSAMRSLLQLLTEKCAGVCVILNGSDENGYRYLIGSRSIALRPLSAAVNAALNGKGGGSDEMLQGTFRATASEIRTYFDSVS